jgi:amino acid adenylation domain-containing protein
MGAEAVTLGATFVPLIDLVDASSPENLAVNGPDGTLTYAELSARAEHLSRRLRQQGVQPGDLVGLCLNRSVSLVVAALAILKAGGVYVAIDPKYPDDRIRWMLDDAAAVAVLADVETADRLGTFGDRPAVVVAAGGHLRADPAADGTGNSQVDIAATTDGADGHSGPTDLAYVVYTSGSTGQPKGVLVEHASLANLVDWHRDAFALSATDRCTQIASPGFDAAVWEIWPCLATGASLHIVPEDVRLDPLGLRDWLVAEGITVTFLPTAVAEGLISLPWPENTALRYLLTGGDALTRRPPADLGFTVVNNYGLSETTVVATSGAVTPDGEGAPTIGAAISGAVAEVVDEDLRPVEPGQPGELVVGGVAVGRGYLNRPELTAERFLDDERGRRYRTGDRVRMRPDGDFEFLGRLDDQLSIRGFRVEPGEVDATLNSHPAIRASITVGVGRSSAQRQLVTYVVAAGQEQPDRAQLSEYLGRFLPEQLLPSRYVWLAELPLTAHGKIDRDALPDVGETAADADETAVGAAQETGTANAASGTETETEAAIAPVLTELLDVPEIGPTQNFFLLGGHSMLGAQLIVRLEKLFDVEISLRFLFDHPTLSEIAAEVDRQRAGAVIVGLRTG